MTHVTRMSTASISDKNRQAPGAAASHNVRKSYTIGQRESQASPTVVERTHSPSPASFSRPRPNKAVNDRVSSPTPDHTSSTASRLPFYEPKTAPSLVNIRKASVANGQDGCKPNIPTFGGRRLDSPADLAALLQEPANLKRGLSRSTGRISILPGQDERSDMPVDNDSDHSSDKSILITPGRRLATVTGDSGHDSYQDHTESSPPFRISTVEEDNSMFFSKPMAQADGGVAMTDRVSDTYTLPAIPQMSSMIDFGQDQSEHTNMDNVLHNAGPEVYPGLNGNVNLGKRRKPDGSSHNHHIEATLSILEGSTIPFFDTPKSKVAEYNTFPAQVHPKLQTVAPGMVEKKARESITALPSSTVKTPADFDYSTPNMTSRSRSIKLASPPASRTTEMAKSGSVRSSSFARGTYASRQREKLACSDNIGSRPGTPKVHLATPRSIGYPSRVSDKANSIIGPAEMTPCPKRDMGSKRVAAQKTEDVLSTTASDAPNSQAASSTVPTILSEKEYNILETKPDSARNVKRTRSRARVVMDNIRGLFKKDDRNSAVVRPNSRRNPSRAARQLGTHRHDEPRDADTVQPSKVVSDTISRPSGTTSEDENDKPLPPVPSLPTISSTPRRQTQEISTLIHRAITDATTEPDLQTRERIFSFATVMLDALQNSRQAEKSMLEAQQAADKARFSWECTQRGMMEMVNLMERGSRVSGLGRIFGRRGGR